MGISYSARLVNGFSMDIESVTADVIRYDQKTGAPRTVTEHSHRVAKVDGVEIMSDADNGDVMGCGERFEGLEVFESGYEHGQQFIGIEEAVVSEYEGDVSEVSGVDLSPLTAFAEKHGLTPKRYLVMSAG